MIVFAPILIAALWLLPVRIRKMIRYNKLADIAENEVDKQQYTTKSNLNLAASVVLLTVIVLLIWVFYRASTIQC